MLKTISAVVLATSLLAAPAMANIVIKTHHAPAGKHVVLKHSIANANARLMSRKHYHHHHRDHHHGGRKLIIRH